MKMVLSSGLLVLFLASAGSLFALDKPQPAFHEELGRAWDDVGRELRDWYGRWREHFSFGATREEQPVISMILRNREKLGLSSEQAKNLEQLRHDFERDSIRKEADLRVAEMDLNELLETTPVDIPKVEAKIREIERLRADIRIARIKTIEKGKDQLTAEQRKKLGDLLSDRRLSGDQPPVER